MTLLRVAQRLGPRQGRAAFVQIRKRHPTPGRLMGPELGKRNKG